MHSTEQVPRRCTLANRIAVFGLFTAALVCRPVVAQQADSRPGATQGAESPKARTYSSPEEAAAALYGAACRNDEAELLLIFGPGGKELIHWSTDPKERLERRERFVQKYDQMLRLVKEEDGTVALYVGAENWPFPIPLVEHNGVWHFDAELGLQEVLYRRIGRNEWEALEVCRALADAEKEYYAVARQYTAKFISTRGTHDGLYWNSAENAGKSPIGRFLANAGIEPTNPGEREPYHGYYYRVLKLAASDGPQGGFAILAFPSEYRSSGVTSFLMDQNGVAYEKDLGPATASLATASVPFPPDSTWKKVE